MSCYYRRKLGQHTLLWRRASLMNVFRVPSCNINSVTSVEDKIPDASVRPYTDIPGPTGIYRLPWIGARFNFKPFTPFAREDIHLLLENLYKKYGPLFRLQLGTDLLVVVDPADVEMVLRNEGRRPRKPSLSVEEMAAKQHSQDQATMPQIRDDWMQVRSPLNKHFARTDSAAQYLPAQGAVTDDFVNILAQKQLQPGQLQQLFLRFMIENMGVVLCNKRLGYMDTLTEDDPESSALLESGKNFFGGMHRSFTGAVMPQTLFYHSKTFKNYKEGALSIMRHATRNAMEAKKNMEENPQEGSLSSNKNVLSSLLSDPQLNDQDVYRLLTIITAGSIDSTAGTLQAFLYNLAKNPDKQETLYKEIVDVMGTQKTVTADHLANMSYLKACLKESFRVLFPVISTTRILPTDLVLQGYAVPAGVSVLFGHSVASKMYFDNPETYLPERWLRSPEGKYPQDIHKMAVLPFGHGPRNCIGKRFAEQELYLATIKVLQRFKIETTTSSNQRLFEHNIFLRPTKPIHFSFLERNK